LRISYPEALARNRCAQLSVEHEWMIPLERIDGESAHLAFLDEPRPGIEARQIVQHTGQARPACIESVPTREQFRTPRHSNAVLVAMPLSDLRTHAPGEFGIR
jgi:hypothetical protein